MKIAASIILALVATFSFGRAARKPAAGNPSEVPGREKLTGFKWDDRYPYLDC